MFENIMNFFKKVMKKECVSSNSKDTAKERLHLVLVQDRANVSADFLELMKQEIIDVIKKYIEIEEDSIDVRLTNNGNEDGTNGAPALYANIPIKNIKEAARKVDKVEESKLNKEQEEVIDTPKEDNIEKLEKDTEVNQVKENIETEKNQDEENSEKVQNLDNVN